MILECPACNSRFLVADALIPPGGRTVRCGACSNQWHVEKPVDSLLEAVPIADPVVEAPAAPVITELPPGSNVPALAKPRLRARPFKIAVPILLLLWAMLAILTYFPRWQNAPVLKSVYAMLGAERTDGLLFTDVRMEKADAGESKTQFIVSGSIVNHAAEVRNVPTVRVMLKDAKGKTVWSRDYAVNQSLKPGEVYPFRIANIETSFGAQVATIVLDLGHGLQLMVRG